MRTSPSQLPHVVRARVHRIKADQRQWINALKLQRGCADCGYAEHAEALDFDHRPDESKHMNIAHMMCYARATIEAEIAKCDVVCANCHRIRTWRRRALSS